MRLPRAGSQPGLACGGCGLPGPQWKGGPHHQGVQRGRSRFCCDSCADERGCTCGRTALEIHLRFSPDEAG